MARLLLGTLASALLLAAAPARAQDALDVRLVPKAQKGQGQPELVVKANTALEKAILTVKRSTDGKRLVLRAGAIGPGRTHSFSLPVKRVGPARFSGELSVELSGGRTGSMPIDVQVELLGPLELTVKPADLDLEKRRLTVAANRPLSKVQVTLTSDEGVPLGTTEAAVDGVDRHTLTYERADGKILQIAVQAWDADGFFGGLKLFPWRVDIPHEEVNFASGQHAIAKSEVAKLEGSYAEITAAIRKYGKLADIRLFIGGHTDTVGDAGSNLALSNRRAAAIAGWFARRGVRIPVLYAGFGESVPLVETPDETDEARNRRAEYIVAVDPPQVAGKAVAWRRAK